MGKIIVVEDNLVFCDFVCNFLEKNGFSTVRAHSCAGARKLFATMAEDDMVVADFRLPEGDGIRLLEELRRQGRGNPFIIMTEYAEVSTAVRSIKSGAEDYIPKNMLPARLLPMLHKLQKKPSIHQEPIFRRESGIFRKIDQRLGIVARSNISVLILGESGTGKRHIAERIHALSGRAGKPFVTVDCGRLSETLAASELFGYEKGAFTGADGCKKGRWAEAEGGTLFLDEIGNLLPGVQQMLLCAIQDKRYRPVGGSRDRQANVRIISATNEDVEAAIAKGSFRQDLYFRLREHIVRIPPLRDCREDILPLAGFFRELSNRELGRQVEGFNAEARKLLLSYTWPGNVRQLKQVVQNAVLFAQGEMVTADDLELGNEPPRTDEDLALKGEKVEKKRICMALKKTGGNCTKACKLLGISRSTLYEKMNLYDIKHGEE